MTIAIISHPDCVLHDAGPGHPEQPDRVRVIQGALERFLFKSPVEFYQAPLASREQLERVHGKDYIDWIFSIAPKQDWVAIDPDTIMNPYTLPAALRAAGAVPFGVDLVMQNKAAAAFCNVRPPGHHAESNTAMGFCFFNNVAVGVAHALAQHGLERVAIVDFDVHRGNGTQQIFQEDARVLYCSSFEYPFYPGYEPEMDNEHILSVPFRAGVGGEEFRETVKKAWFDALTDFKPQFVFFSAGFDAHVNDPIGQMKLTEADYVWLTQQVAAIARKTAGGKMVSVLEGGYNLEALEQCAPAHINALGDSGFEPLTPTV